MDTSNTFYVLCGLPASGKTAYSKQLAESTNSKYYSFDEYPDSCSPRMFNQVKQQMYQDIYDDLRTGYDVVLDDLHTKKVWRENMLSVVQDIQCKKILIVMATPVKECLSRNSTRRGKGRLPDFVIQILNQRYEVPTECEGWDEIIYV